MTRLRPRCAILGAAQSAIIFNYASFPTCYGPEYISSTLMIWAEKQGIALNHIQPGKAQQIATDWRWTYNSERPNMGIGGITPAQKLKMVA